jgi:hypothetical protein
MCSSTSQTHRTLRAKLNLPSVRTTFIQGNLYSIYLYSIILKQYFARFAGSQFNIGQSDTTAQYVH